MNWPGAAPDSFGSTITAIPLDVIWWVMTFPTHQKVIVCKGPAQRSRALPFSNATPRKVGRGQGFVRCRAFEFAFVRAPLPHRRDSSPPRRESNAVTSAQGVNGYVMARVQIGPNVEQARVVFRTASGALPPHPTISATPSERFDLLERREAKVAVDGMLQAPRGCCKLNGLRRVPAHQ
jgi:hypothetical protein